MIKSDTPIRSKKEDLLNRYKFASSLGKAFLEWENEEGIVVGLYGKWGSGKSSVINLAIEYIETEIKKKRYKKQDKPVIIKFNPWNFTEQNQLINIFFSELAKAIKYYDKGEDAKKIGKKLVTYSKFFSVLSFIPGLDPYTKIVEKVFRQVGETTKDWGELQTKNLERYKEELDSSIKKFGKKIIIVIDDIDRLNPKEIKQIFQLVKQNANFPNTLYLLSLDQQKAIKEIKEDYEFLEKIIQVSFHIPVVEDIRLKKILFAELDSILKPFSENLWDSERWTEIFNNGYKDLFDSVRKIKRYINSLQFNINIISTEINPLDFFVMEAIRVFFPSFYEEIGRNKELFVGRTFLDNDKDRNARKQQFEKMLDLIENEGEKIIVRNLIFNLFPQVAGVYRNQTTNENGDWFKEKRICAERRFGNYFYLTLPEGEISQREMDFIIKASDNSDELNIILGNLLKENRIRRCLERLPEFIDSIPNKNVYTFILAFFNISDRISRERSGDLDFGVEIELVRLAHHLIKKLSVNERYNVIEKLINNSESVDSPARLISIEKEAYDDGKNEKIIEITEIEKLIRIILEKIKNYARSGKLIKSPGLAYIFYRWKQWENINEPQKYTTELIKTPQGIVTLLKGFTGQSISGNKIQYKLSFKDIKEFIDLQVLKSKISQLKNKDRKVLGKDNVDILDGFMKKVDKVVAGQDVYF